jgi:hypothetical protein
MITQRHVSRDGFFSALSCLVSLPSVSILNHSNWLKSEEPRSASGQSSWRIARAPALLVEAGPFLERSQLRQDMLGQATRKGE